MAYKMKAGPGGPFRKNFPSVFKNRNDWQPSAEQRSKWGANWDENVRDRGTSSRWLTQANVPYSTRSDYLNWKRTVNRGGDKSFNTYLNRNKKKPKVKRDDYGSLVSLDTIKVSDL
tara:strand:- start:382 stop:729 length:348 start_codon:yes stop_codon:yes gene_type:complete